MASESAAQTAPQTTPNVAVDKGAFAKVEKTKNNTGFTFMTPDESLEYWLNSLPDSDKPLLDLGATYGVNTIRAMKHGRDVIANDKDERHIATLDERCAAFTINPPADAVAQPGLLVRSAVATLPAPDLCEPESISGAYLCELIQYFKPQEPLAVFKDVYRWLVPGGRLVSTSCSAADIDAIEKAGCKTYKDRSIQDIRDMINGPADELVDSAVTFVTMPENFPMVDLMGPTAYLMSEKELEATAKAAGFEVERCEYISSDKYPFRTENSKDEITMLIARKPLN